VTTTPVFASPWDHLPRREWRPPATRTVVVAAHPDDEVLGCGGLIATQRAAGADVVVLAVTDGEAASDDPRLARRRRDEQRRALAVLGVDASRTIRLALPDSAVGEHEDELVRRAIDLLRPTDLLVAPFAHDHHSDHEACGRAAVRVRDAVGCELVHALVWAPIRRMVPATGRALLCHRLDVRACDARDAAMRHHRSQTDPAEGPAVVTDELLVRLASPFELYVDGS
jgi:LmbE family N-acetylglucosaminyl deacetylase